MARFRGLKRFLVTGGAGFIGSHLADLLLSEGGAVTVYDNGSSAYRPWLDARLQERHPRFRYVQADLQDLGALRAAAAGQDMVWHLGANGDIPRGMRQTDLDLKNGLVATWNVLEAMRLEKVKYLVFPSTSAVYGEIDIRPTNERHGPLLPISLYGASKLSAEGFISAFTHLFGLQAWIFRFGNVVGARMGHGVLFDFIRKLSEDPAELEVLGDGNQEKNYLLVEECIDGMATLFEKTDKPCDVFNLGSDSTIKVRDIARIAIEAMGLKDTRLRFTGGVRGWPGDAPKAIYDTSKADSLGWKTRHDSTAAVRIAAARLVEDRRKNAA